MITQNSCVNCQNPRIIVYTANSRFESIFPQSDHIASVQSSEYCPYYSADIFWIDITKFLLLKSTKIIIIPMPFHFHLLSNGFITSLSRYSVVPYQEAIPHLASFLGCVFSMNHSDWKFIFTKRFLFYKFSFSSNFDFAWTLLFWWRSSHSL